MSPQETLLTNRRFATIIGLTGVAAVHVMDLPGKLQETPYLGYGYIAVIIACGVLIERLLVRASHLDYLASAALAASVILGFVINRTVGMPGAMGDRGNWFEPLGLMSLFVEAFACWHALRGAGYLRRALARG